MNPLTIDSNLFQFCTPRQKEILEAVNLYGSARAASVQLGLNKDAASKAYMYVRRKAARSGYSPQHDWTHQVPDGYVAKGVSTYYNSEGKPSGWRFAAG